jgi:hypothetical protein
MVSFRGVWIWKWRVIGPFVGCLAFASPALTAETADMVGAWDLNLDKTPRQCRIVLRNDVVAAGNSLALPAGCRRGMPVLADVVGWSPVADGIELNDVSGKVILQFSMTKDGYFSASGPEGETYSFNSADPKRRARLAAAMAPAGGSSPLTSMAGFQAQTKPKAAAPAAAVKAAELPGRYSIFREGPKDTACMLTLDDKARGPKGSMKAVLSPACRDQGMVIFDPAGWTLERGRLVLTARKGHQAHFDRQSDGSWSKDPKDGKQLILKKL